MRISDFLDKVAFTINKRYDYGNNPAYYNIQTYYVSGTVMTVSNVTVTSNWEQQGRLPGIRRIVGVKYTVPETYSLNEQIVGTWIDGKPLYQKTVVIANPVMDNWSNLISYASLGINNIDKVWKVDSAFVTVSTPSLSWTMNEFYSSEQDNFCVAVFSTDVRIGYANTATNRTFTNLTFTLKYTKTT